MRKQATPKTKTGKPDKTAAAHDALRPDPRNARRHPERNKGMIRNSLQEVGAGRSILVDGENIIRAGNGVYEQAQALGLTVRVVDAKPDELIAVRRPDLKGKKAIRAALLDNRAGETSEWDVDVLAEMPADLIGNLFTDKELKALGVDGGGGSDVDAEPQIDRAEELRKKWGVETGQLWRLGEHRLICGDCTDKAVVDRVMGGDEPALIIADPPYGINIVAANVSVGGGEAYNIPFGGKRSKRLGATNGAKPFGSKRDRVRGSDRAANAVDVGKYAPIIGDETTDTAVKASTFLIGLYGKSVHIWWGANYYADKLPPSSCWLVWDKETTGNFADCELAWTNQDRAAKLFRHKWNGMLRASERERRWHPTQKPAALAAWVFSEFCQKQAIVLDPFSGGGWSVLGAEQAGYCARAIELSSDYCAVILQRWADATGKTPELIDDSRSARSLDGDTHGKQGKNRQGARQKRKAKRHS